MAELRVFRAEELPVRERDLRRCVHLRETVRKVAADRAPLPEFSPLQNTDLEAQHHAALGAAGAHTEDLCAELARHLALAGDVAAFTHDAGELLDWLKCQREFLDSPRITDCASKSRARWGSASSTLY